MRNDISVDGKANKKKNSVKCDKIYLSAVPKSLTVSKFWSKFKKLSQRYALCSWKCEKIKLKNVTLGIFEPVHYFI